MVTDREIFVKCNNDTDPRVKASDDGDQFQLELRVMVKVDDIGCSAANRSIKSLDR